MKTTLMVGALVAVIFPTMGCGLAALAAYRAAGGGSGWLSKATSGTPLVETLVVDADVDEPAARMAHDAALVLAVYEREPGAADALAAALRAYGLEYAEHAASPPYAIAHRGVPSQGRTVILVLAPDAHVTLGETRFGTFEHLAFATQTRSWTSLDLDIGERRVRVIAADLAAQEEAATEIWRSELEAGPGATPREVIYSQEPRL